MNGLLNSRSSWLAILSLSSAMHAELRCTYRLQLTSSFNLHHAASLVDYLTELGVSHLYLSPVLQAGPDSQHGYDVTDPTQISEGLGGMAALEKLFQKARSRGMAVVLDIVPNHLASIPQNPWWWDVLEKGESSEHAGVFDIDWDPRDGALKGKVLVPTLGDHLGKVLSRNELKIGQRDDGTPVIRYFEHAFPINVEGRRLWEEGAGLEEVLDVQHYRLAYWRVGPDEINYRRFFDVETLVGARVEDPHVFDATHAKLLELVKTGPVDGLRIDHPDGLRDPAGYFKKLSEEAPGCWLLAEKILEPGEKLVSTWPIHGTTGYDFLQRVGGLFIDPSGEKPISDFHADFTGHTEPFGALVRERKRRVLELSFDGDLRRLVEYLRRICAQASVRYDYPRRVLRELLIEILASFPIYRTYVNPERGEVTGEDRETIRLAVASTRRRDHPFDDELLDFLEKLLCGETTGTADELEFVFRFQQLTGPVMAKGVEDTTFYCYDRLLALNEVGCDPARFGVSAQAYHTACIVAHADWPKSMLATSTHDTKRGEDVRMRLSLLSEIAEQWAEQVRLWSNHNQSAWEGREPDRNAEHLLYQTLVGAWPIEIERVELYMHKACREAKSHTSWTHPDEAYEARIREFARTVLADPEFVAMLENFVKPLVPLGRINSLSQTLLKLTAPGIPDIYQGCEIWDNSLVDPDNRRPVDYDARRKMLSALDGSSDRQTWLERSEEGLPKLHLIRQTLALRKRIPNAFEAGPQGEYRPLLVTGQKLEHVVAFGRGERVAVIVPRLVYGVRGDWADTTVELGEGLWTHVIDGSEWQGKASMTEIFSKFPVALLEKTSIS